MRCFIFSLIVAFFSINQTHAQTLKTCDTRKQCDDMSGAEAKECYGRLLKVEDDRLNNTFKLLIKKIQSTGYTDPDKIEAELRSSQRQWIKYRDSYCNYRFSTAEGGTLGGLLKLDCSCTLTRDKADHLVDDLAN
ncbi:uncharacterized protein YecT (DUF1311 family) [Labrenzia sp. EL_126]|nr:uncharacterized protein YecT (DUF1311 family) [Labrenzia sp. EL_126]